MKSAKYQPEPKGDCAMQDLDRETAAPFAARINIAALRGI